MPDVSVSSLVAQLARNDQAANDAASLLDSCFRDRLITLAARQFDTWLRERADPEGIVQSVFRSVVARTRAGKLNALADWNHLWRLLVRITLAKCANRYKQLRRQKRDVGLEVSEALALESPGREPTPEEAAELADLVRVVLHSFDPADQPVVAHLLQGELVAEVCQLCGRPERTVRRLQQQLFARLERRLVREN